MQVGITIETKARDICDRSSEAATDECDVYWSSSLLPERWNRCAFAAAFNPGSTSLNSQISIRKLCHLIASVLSNHFVSIHYIFTVLGILTAIEQITQPRLGGCGFDRFCAATMAIGQFANLHGMLIYV